MWFTLSICDFAVTKSEHMYHQFGEGGGCGVGQRLQCLPLAQADLICLRVLTV